MKKMILGFTLFLSFLGHATTIEELRSSFSPLASLALQKFEEARKMLPREIVRGQEISLEECQSLQEKIRQNSKVDPFEVTFENGSAHHFLCGGREGWHKNYVKQLTGTTNRGLKFSYVIQRDGDEFWRDQISHYLINDQNRIVEIHDLAHHRRTGELLEYTVTSLDANGDVYTATVMKNHSIVGTDITGLLQKELFISQDGDHPFPLLRSTVTHPTDPSKNFQAISLYRTQKDWDAYELPLTHAWASGFYFYAGKISPRPHQYQNLVVKFRGGKELCAAGSIIGAQSEFLPAGAAHYDCLNY